MAEKTLKQREQDQFVTTVLGAVVIGSSKNETWEMGILTTRIGTFMINTFESPTTVEEIKRLEAGDVVEIKMHDSFHPTTRQSPSGEEIHEVACTKFTIVDGDMGVAKKELSAFASRTPRKAIIGKGKAAAPPKEEKEKEAAEKDNDY